MLMDTPRSDEDITPHADGETRRGALRTVAGLGAATLAVLGLTEAPAAPAKAGKNTNKKKRKKNRNKDQGRGGGAGFRWTFGARKAGTYALNETVKLTSVCPAGTTAVAGSFNAGGVCPLLGNWPENTQNAWTFRFRCTEAIEEGATTVFFEMAAVCLS